MWFSVFVKDRRYIGGWTVRRKYFETLAEGEKWVKSLKNRLYNNYTVRANVNGKKLEYRCELQEFKNERH